jgi:putative intracellular protease/amidase
MKGTNVWLAVICAGVLVLATALGSTDTSVPWDKILVKDAMEHFN